MRGDTCACKGGGSGKGGGEGGDEGEHFGEIRVSKVGVRR